MLHGIMILTGELESMREEAVVASFKILSHSPETNEQKYEGKDRTSSALAKI
jgi:hypothetical protein